MQSSAEENLDSSHSVRFDRKTEETESEFRVFYENVLKFQHKILSMEFNNIRQSLRNIRSYRNPDVEVHETVDFESKYDRCAYVLAYCIIHSIVVYEQFSGMIKNNPSMLKKIASMKTIRLCILGGGSAFEAVAICKLLSRILVQFNPENRPPLQVQVTIIDICADWETEAKGIMRSFQNELCNENNVEVDCNFIEADLTEDFSPTVTKAIEKSHFVTMFKFVSDVSETSSEKKVTWMIRKIIESMSSKSCLFFLDTSGGGTFDKFGKMIDDFTCTSRIYGPCLHNCHKLDPDTAEKFSNGVRRGLKCTNQTTTSCSAWLIVGGVVKLKDLAKGTVYTPPEVLQDLEKYKCKEKPRKIKIKNVTRSNRKTN